MVIKKIQTSKIHLDLKKICDETRIFEMLMNVYPVTWLITATFVLGSYYLIQRNVFVKMKDTDTVGAK